MTVTVAQPPGRPPPAAAPHACGGSPARSALLLLATALLLLLALAPPALGPALQQPASPAAPGAPQPQQPAPAHGVSSVLVLLLCRAASARTLARLRALVAAGLDAHALPDEQPLPSALAAAPGRLHWQPTARVVAAGYLLLNPKMPANTSTWDRALLHAAGAARGRATWLVEDDVWFASGRALARVVEAYAARDEDLVASELLSRGPDVDEGLWYWWQRGHVLEVPGLRGGAMLPRYPGAPTMGTLNVLCRLSARLVAEVAAVARQHGRLVLHEALFASLVAARWREGWGLTWLAHPWSVIRWRPVVPLAEARAGAESHGWLVVHPVKLNESSAEEVDAVLEGEDAGA